MVSRASEQVGERDGRRKKSEGERVQESAEIPRIEKVNFKSTPSVRMGGIVIPSVAAVDDATDDAQNDQHCAIASVTPPNVCLKKSRYAHDTTIPATVPPLPPPPCFDGDGAGGG